MSKRAIYYDEAERLYVRKGLDLDAIESFFDNNISRRQLYNWKNEGRWDEKRKSFAEQHEDMDEMIRDTARICIRNAREDPSPKNMLAMKRALEAVQLTDALTLLQQEVKEGESKEGTDVSEAIEAVKKYLGA